jgi:SAM-dependent methyltransferase
LDSIGYYNRYAATYFESTVNVDLSENRARFEKVLPEGGSILDLGCGSGRDSLAFLEDGYEVTPLDGSPEMCALAEIHTDLEVLNMTFEELDFDEVFDGIWACASLLHVPEEDMPDILKKVGLALKPEGHLYISVKEGDFEGERDNRYYVDYTKRRLMNLLEETGVFKVKEVWKTQGLKTMTGDTRWLNIIAKKFSAEEE